MSHSDRWVTVGAIVKPHGVRGEVRVKLFNDESDVLLHIGSARLEREGAPVANLAIRSARPAVGGFVLLTFDGVADRDAAESLRGGLLSVPRDALPPPAQGEFYVCDVLGARVVLSDGTEAGTVVDFQSFPSTEVLVVERDGRRFDVPLVDDFVASVDIEHKRVVVISLDGLESS